MKIEDLPAANYSMISLGSLSSVLPSMYERLPAKEILKLRKIVDQTIDEVLKLTRPQTINKLQNEAVLEILKKKKLQELQKE